MYFYASLGMLMLTGIMAIFEMAVSFNSQQMNFRPPGDSYLGSKAQTADRDLMALLATPDLLISMGRDVSGQQQPWTGQSLCDQLMCRVEPGFQSVCQGTNAYDDTLFGQSPLASYRPGLQTTSSSPGLLGSCALSSPQSDHRVLVVPNASADPIDVAMRPYQLYSCSLEQETTCSFEQD